MVDNVGPRHQWATTVEAQDANPQQHASRELRAKVAHAHRKDFFATSSFHRNLKSSRFSLYCWDANILE